MGKNPIISRFLKGVFNKKPTKAKYQRIYDLEPILKELENLYSLEKLTLQDLTDKLVALLAIVTAHRKQTKSLIKVSNIRKINNEYKIEISDRVKTAKILSTAADLTNIQSKSETLCSHYSREIFSHYKRH